MSERETEIQSVELGGAKLPRGSALVGKRLILPAAPGVQSTKGKTERNRQRSGRSRKRRERIHSGQINPRHSATQARRRQLVLMQCLPASGDPLPLLVPPPPAENRPG
ncbi:hypothetical protein AOLI_G00090100 [Acnodon oligacanthus]